MSETTDRVTEFLSRWPLPGKRLGAVYPGTLRDALRQGLRHEEIDHLCRVGLVVAAARCESGRSRPEFDAFATAYMRAEVQRELRQVRRAGPVCDLGHLADHRRAEEATDVLDLVRRTLCRADAHVIARLFGLDGGRPAEEAELAEQMGVTRSRVNQRKAMALRRLKARMEGERS